MKTIFAILLLGSVATAETPCEMLTRFMWESYKADKKLVQAVYVVGDMSDAAYVVVADMVDDQLKAHKEDLETFCGRK